MDELWVCSKNRVRSVRKASGWVSALMAIFLVCAYGLSYGVYGIELLLNGIAGIQIDIQIYEILTSVAPTLVGSAAVILAARKITGIRFKELFIRPQLRPSTAVLGTGACMGLNVVSTLLTLWLIRLAAQIGIMVYVPDFSFYPNSPVVSAVTVIYACLLAPVLEEIIFRGYILRYLQGFGSLFAILFTSLLFALYHGNLGQLIFPFMASCLFCSLTLHSRSLIPSIVIHTANNLLAIVLDSVVSRMPLEVSSVVNIIWVLTGVICLVAFVVLYGKGFSVLRHPLPGQLSAKKALGAAASSPIWILFLLYYLVSVSAVLIAMNT